MLTATQLHYVVIHSWEDKVGVYNSNTSLLNSRMQLYIKNKHAKNGMLATFKENPRFGWHPNCQVFGQYI